MTVSTKVLSQKQILNDPVNAFLLLNPGYKITEDGEFEELAQQKFELTRQQKDFRAEAKKLSRKIGEAKQNKTDTDELILAMQTISKKVKEVTGQTKIVETSILSFFETPNDQQPQPPEHKAPIFPCYTLRKTGTKINIDDISVRQFEGDSLTWNDYVNTHPAGCIHHLYQWRTLFKDSYSLQTFLLCCL